MYEFALSNISKSMGEYGVLENIDLFMAKGERICLLGPSGCGKTTLLRIAAGLEKPDSGDVIFRGKSLINVPPHRRNFGMMFQDFALFPHRNVFDNIAFGLEIKGEIKERISSRVFEMLELVNLEGYGHRRVDELSGGERQRVALARTLAPEPYLVMLDEPLGSLDRLLRERLLADLCTILTDTGVTTIFVTHDQNEAFAAADRICIMTQGRILQTDVPEHLYNYPVNARVADFLGFQNIIPGNFDPNCGSVLTEIGSFNPLTVPSENGEYDLLILPSAATFVSGKEKLEENSNLVFGRIKNLFFQGCFTRVVLETANGMNFVFDMIPKEKMPLKGEKVCLGISPLGLRLINKVRPGEEYSSGQVY